MSRKPAPRAAKRRAILAAARQLFLQDGYQGTSVDQIAALATVSKQTVYKHFQSKEQLYAAIIDEIAARAGEFVESEMPALRATDDVRGDLQRFARRYLATVMQPAVIQVRRLVIGEAGRLQEIARGYHDRVPAFTLLALAECFAELDRRHLLAITDSHTAADHFAFMVLGGPLDRALFLGQEHGLTEADLDHHADVGVDTFLRAYARRPGSRSSTAPLE